MAELELQGPLKELSFPGPAPLDHLREEGDSRDPESRPSKEYSVPGGFSVSD